jgi:hypothetical protein
MEEKIVDYSTRIPILREELRTKTLGEAEKERGIVRMNYIGIGYGYNLKKYWPKNMKDAEKDVKIPELKWLEKMIAAMEL